MIPPAWQLAYLGMATITLFAAWKLAIAPRLTKRANASSS